MTSLLAHRGEWILLNGGPALLVLLALVAAAGVVSGLRSSRGLSLGRRALLLSVRLAAVLAAGAALLRPARETDLVRPRKPPLAVVVDSSRSMSLGNDPLAPRLGSWLRRSGAVGELRDYFRVEAFALGDPAPRLELGSMTEGGAFVGVETPLGRTLEALAKARPDLAGIVLFSDGRDTERPGEAPAALPVPIYPVLPGAGETPDLRIESVETPPVGFIRTPLEIRVRLGLSGLRPGTATVTLSERGSVLQTRSVQVGRDGAAVALSFTPTRTGRKAYRVEVSHWPGDAAPENDRAQFALNVVRDKTRVLLVAGTPTWDVKYLRRRLLRDPGVDLISFLILRTPEDVSTVPQSELSLIPFPTEELFNQELPSFDAVIFADFDYAPYVPRQYLTNLVKFVKEKGGGFAMLGGDRSFGLGGFEGTPLEEILPVELSGAPPGREYLALRFRPRLTSAGSTHPLFQWLPNPEENRQLWTSLPELEGLNWVLKAKPQAVVLAESPEARNEHGPVPVVALGEYGTGRTLAVTTDSLWRWAAAPAAGPKAADQSAYRDFWTRALRWLSHDPEMELVRLSAPASIRAGEPLQLRARVYDRSYAPASHGELQGNLAREDGRKLPVRWRESGPGEYVSDTVRLSPSGLWRAEIEARRGGTLLGRDSAEFAVGPESLEALRVGADRSYLDALAKNSGGRTFPLEDESLREFLLAKGKASVEVVGRRVDERWANAWFLALTAALFALDWTLRRFLE